MPYINGLLKKKRPAGPRRATASSRWATTLTVRMLDEIKEVAFLYATWAGISFGVDDMVVPSRKQEIRPGRAKRWSRSRTSARAGVITAG